MLPGETIASGAPSTCADCGKELKLEVLSSNAGYYIGTWCNCGPSSRESDYYPSREKAQQTSIQECSIFGSFRRFRCTLNERGNTMPVQQSVKEILLEAREIIDGEMSSHTPEYRALDKLERALDQLCGEVVELNSTVFPQRDR